MKRVQRDSQSILLMDSNPSASCQIINLFLVLIRYNFNYSNAFYKLNKYLSLIISIHSIILMLLSIFLYGTFEVLFKLESLITDSINIYCYFLIASLMLSILLMSFTHHALFHFGTIVYSQKEYQVSNQVKKNLFLFIRQEVKIFFL